MTHLNTQLVYSSRQGNINWFIHNTSGCMKVNEDDFIILHGGCLICFPPVSLSGFTDIKQVLINEEIQCVSQSALLHKRFFITNGVDKWQERIIKMNNSITLKKYRKVLMRIIILQLQVASQPLDFVLDKVEQKRIELNFYHTCTNMQVVQVMYKRHSLWPVGWQRNATVMQEHQSVTPIFKIHRRCSWFLSEMQGQQSLFFMHTR